jgi:hypothetical protein
MLKDPLEHIEQVTRRTDEYMGEKTRTVFGKYPVTFSFLVLFGVIAVLHGFEDIINRVPLFNDHPVFVFIIGLVILIFTGSLYKRLDKRLD